MDEQDPPEDRFHEILYYFDWWDCPRSGLCVMDGQPTHFISQFSEELDDYPDEFFLWPATAHEVTQGLKKWREFAAWRSRFDRGAISTSSAEWTHVVERSRELQLTSSPPTATRAIPRWRLDTNRSFANGIPRHFVQWRVQS